MKTISKFLALAFLGAIATTGCSFQDLMFWKKRNNSEQEQQKEPLVIPTVDVNSLHINLPDLPTRNQGSPRSEDGHDYIDLYEISDFHGAVNYELHSDGDYIGLSKLASYFDNVRQNNEGGTLILSCGDMFQGSADSNLTRGYMVNYAMHYMGFDAMTVGNHEFDWGAEWLKKNAELSYNDYSIPYLGANITKSGEFPTYLNKSVIVTRGEYKIGVIGVIGSELENTILKSALADYSFSLYEDIVNAEALRLKSEEGCNAVALLAHEAADGIVPVANVDAVFGGHAHENCQNSVNGAPSLATANYGQSIAHMTLKFNSSTKEFEETINPEIIQTRSIGSGLSENSGIKSIMEQYAPAINEIKHIKLGTCDAELQYDKALKNICTKAMFDAAITSVKANSDSGIDPNKVVCAFHNVSGGIRDNIAKGDITYGDVYKAFPFDNEVILFETTGEEICSKLSNLSELGIYKIFEKRDYFTPSEKYYIVTTDFLALSSKYIGGKYRVLEDKDLIRTGRVVRDEVANSIYQLDTLENAKLAANEPCYRPVSITF